MMAKSEVININDELLLLKLESKEITTAIRVDTAGSQAFKAGYEAGKKAR